MQPTGKQLAEVIRVLQQPDRPTSGQDWPVGVPLPAPDVTPTRCGCRVPLIWDAHLGRWLHLDDLTPCVPGRPRH